MLKHSAAAPKATSVRQPRLNLDEIQGDVLLGLQKNAEAFVFFKIQNISLFKQWLRQFLQHITNTRQVQYRDLILRRYRQMGRKTRQSLYGLNLGFTWHGLNALVGIRRPGLDPSFEEGADSPGTIARLNDPPKSRWLPKFTSDRIDGVFLITGPDPPSVTFHFNS